MASNFWVCIQMRHVTKQDTLELVTLRYLLKIPSGKGCQSLILTVQTVLDYVFGRLDIAALDSTTNDHRIWMDDDIGLSLARNSS